MEIVESNGIVKYIWMEVTTAPCLAVPTIEESQKGYNFRFSLSDVLLGSMVCCFQLSH